MGVGLRGRGRGGEWEGFGEVSGRSVVREGDEGER